MCVREDFVKDFTNLLVAQNIDNVSLVRNLLLVTMDSYEISERCTDIVLHDDTQEAIVKNYAFSMISEGIAKSTVKTYTDLILRFASEITSPLLTVNTNEIRTWLAKRQMQVSLRTCENNRSYLSSFYQWLVKEDYIEKNPMSKIRPIKHPENYTQPFEDVDVDKVRSECKSLRVRAEFEFLLSSGIRVSELVALNKSDVNFQTKEVIIRHGKGNKFRKVYINQIALYHLVRYLNSRKDNNEALFMNRNGNRLRGSNVENDLRNAGDRAGVPNTKPHRCRSTFASNMARKGMDVRTIQLLLGHSSLETTMGYITFVIDHVQSQYQYHA